MAALDIAELELAQRRQDIQIYLCNLKIRLRLVPLGDAVPLAFVLECPSVPFVFSSYQGEPSPFLLRLFRLRAMSLPLLSNARDSQRSLAGRCLCRRRDPSSSGASRRQVREALVAAGLVLPEPAAPQGQPLSEQARDELARRIPAGRPLSEIIIEEREGR